MIINAERVARDVIVIVASAGGLLPLRELCTSLAPDLPAALAVVFHRNPYSDGQILSILQRSSRVPVIEPEDGEPFVHGTVYLAPRDRHLLLDHGSFLLS